MVHNCLFVSSQEPLLESLGVGHGCSLVAVARVEAIGCHVARSANLEVSWLEVGVDAAIFAKLNLRVGLTALSFRHLLDDFVETRKGNVHLSVSCMEVLTRRHISELVLDDGVHLSYREKDASSKLVLVIDSQPPIEDIPHSRLQHLGCR